ncbi:STAS/SEC14 domain-containing protein [Flavobacterium sp. MFBS3-15]|uniref:STAS/SEC14 domain-containing protein n=1 Tax=Flavobacterium sp. MFBS3-15 TaxID=2989816 RepID=UPI002235E872|nr:STAS/SEC14 domain-containing protein [Flavobacterium sp. MFBS3-15]MCW4470162.1 STAS/SEC14 domain-containing protein [Flavobacterium sp. MFBS3-15]
MIIQIPDLPDNMVGFRADREVTKEDFEIVKLQVSHLVEKTGKLNYMLVLDNSPADFTLGAWFQDALLGIQNITKWNRAAIISDSEVLKTFTDIFSKVMPGEFRAYKHTQYDEAVDWVSERSQDEGYNN